MDCDMTAFGLPLRSLALLATQLLIGGAAGPALDSVVVEGGSGTDSMTVSMQDDALTGSLFRVATDASMVVALHDVLGSFCHECRNTLNSLKLSLYLAKRGASLSASDL